jgi:UDP-N-acetylglucosamine--N-acetylmuramyl-(pentapeptide) pyrophosphoryl-undecaprenol N-acetylglucosamine transferase
MWFVFAGGGTGGHLFPALAVVDELRLLAAGASETKTATQDGIEVSFLCTPRPIDAQVLGAAQIEAIRQPVRPFTVRPWRWPAFWKAWRASLAHCRKLFRARRPAAVVGAGGYASGPAVRVALDEGIPTFLLNPDAIPGRANRYLAGHNAMAGIFAQWEVTRGHLPASAPVEVTGCPVRRAFHEADRRDRRELLRSFELDPDRRVLLVTGASQGARTINEAMIALADTFDWTGWQVLHLAGQVDVERVSAAYGQAFRRRHGAARVLAFTDRMAEAMAAADLVISRAGASTLAELLVLGKPSILLPYPYHRDQHQRRNAEVLAQAGAAVLIDDARDVQLNRGPIEAALGPLMQDDAQRDAMARSARSLAKPEAGRQIAQRLLEAGLTSSGSACELCDCGPVTLTPH